MTRQSVPDLDWFVHWRPTLWTPAVRAVLGDPSRFKGKRVLEIGYRTGRMACYFALLGAQVHGVDLPDCDPAPATRLAEELGVADRVSFSGYGGDLGSLSPAGWDFVFTKSVLVLLPAEVAIPAVRALLVPGGQYLACENRVLPFGLDRLRRYQVGVSEQTYSVLRGHFAHVVVKSHFGIVASIVATA
jgi:SAM-dependent methyltransferase